MRLLPPKRATFLRLVRFLGAALPLWVTHSPQAAEYRALWVDAWGAGFLNPTQTTELIAHSRKHNFNAVFVQMRRRGDSFFAPGPATPDPKTTAVSSNYDALADLIQKARVGSPRVEIHCWVTSNLIWSGSSAPSHPGHVFNLHPEYLTRNSLGQTQIAEGYYLDPGHPEATRWNYRMATDIVRRYAVDGFHWDYIRYPVQDSGFNATAVARYNAEYGAVGVPTPADGRFMAWRRRQVTDFLRWANADLLEIRPNLVISAAVFANRSDAADQRFQDWAVWNNEGLLDLCVPMNYTATASTYTSRLNDALARRGRRWVVMGQAGYLNTPQNTVAQLLEARGAGAAGFCIYSYRTPNAGTPDLPGTYGHLTPRVQPEWVAPPELPWKADPTHGLVKGIVRRFTTGEPIYNATVTLQGAASRSQRTGPHGSFAFFDAPTGVQTVMVSAPGFAAVSSEILLEAGEIESLTVALPEPQATPPRFTGIRVAADGRIQMEIVATPGHTYALEGSGDFVSWVVISTHTPPTAAFTVVVERGEPTRFLRLRGM